MPFVLEPGPLKLITADEIPRARLLPGLFESTAAPVSAELDAHHAALAAPAARVGEALGGDPDADYQSILPPAVDEINAQLGSLSEIDPAHAYVSALEAAGETEGLLSSFAPQGSPLFTIELPPDDADPIEVKDGGDGA